MSGAQGRRLAAGLFSMTISGTPYWVPSLAATLAEPLRLNPNQAAAFAAAACSGYIVSIFPGLMHTRLGPRRTAILGSVGLSLTYASLAVCVWARPANPLPLLLFLALMISMTSYCTYSATQSATVAAFPVSSRGSVNGLLSAVYAMSSGIVGAMQAAVFPSIGNDGEASNSSVIICLLLFVSLLATVPLICSFLYFPQSLNLSPHRAFGRNVYDSLSTSEGSSISSGDGEVEQSGYAVKVGYCSAVAVAVTLQVCAVVDWKGNVVLFGTRGELVVGIVLVVLLSTLVLPGLVRSTSSESTCFPEHSVGSEPADGAGSAIVPLADLAVDFRFIFILGSLFCLAGCGGLTLLNTLEGALASRAIAGQYLNSVVPSSVLTSKDVVRQVRAVVVLFSATSVAGRLAAGLMMDFPKRGGPFWSSWDLLTWRLFLLQLVTALMGVTLLVLSIASVNVMFFCSGLIGFAYGSFFAIAPVLSQDFFGLTTFPRDFALGGVGAGVGSLLVAWIASILSRRRVASGSWADLHVSLSETSVSRRCSGKDCYLATYALCASVQFAFLLVSSLARNKLAGSKPASPS